MRQQVDQMATSGSAGGATSLAARTKRAAFKILPVPAVSVLRRLRHWRDEVPPLGYVRFGQMRRVTPLSPNFGWARGLPIDRYYIEQFLGRHARDIRGHVLEVENNAYTRAFGSSRVTRSDVLHARAGNPAATIVGDLCTGEGIPRGAFDCMILTQLFSFLYDFRAGLGHAVEALKPGGVMLATFAGIAQISRDDADQWGDFWRFTSYSASRLFAEFFPASNLSIGTCGNVLAATAFLQGIVVGELRAEELDHHDRDYEMIITVRAVKP